MCFHRAAHAVLEDVGNSIVQNLQEDGTTPTNIITTPVVGASRVASESSKKSFAKIKEGIVDSKTIRLVSPHVICQFPDKYLSFFLEYHRTRLPDMSEGKKVIAKDLKYWRGAGSLSAVLSQHSQLPGLCAKWVNLSVDFAMARFSCVRFVL